MIEQFEKFLTTFINQYDQIILDGKKFLNIDENGKFVIGKLAKAAQNYVDAHRNDISDAKYYEFDYEVNSIKLHRQGLRYSGLPALFTKEFPHYNAQLIHPINDEKNLSYKIAMAQGPFENQVATMLEGFYNNQIETIVVIGVLNESASHHDYYTQKECILPNGEKIASEFNGNQESILQHFKIHYSNANQQFSFNMHWIQVHDGNRLNLTLTELFDLYKQIKNKNVAVHCSAGISRSSVIACSLKAARQKVFDILNAEVDATKFYHAILEAADKRLKACASLNNFQQIIQFSIAFLAFDKGLTPDQFPDQFFNKKLNTLQSSKIDLVIPKPNLFSKQSINEETKSKFITSKLKI